LTGSGPDEEIGLSYDTITIERRDGAAILAFNRPRVLNAFDPGLIDETNAAMAELGADDATRAIVVRGEGRAFSAGFDLKTGAATAGQRDQAGWRKVLEADLAFIMQFWDCPKPTIAAVHGYCIGGAFELALACDITVAAEGTRFGVPEVKFGSGAVALLLPWIAGSKAAREILLTGDDQLSAERACELGIVNRVVAPGRELDEALAIAGSMAAASTSAVRLSKLAINRSFDAMGLRTALAQALELDIFIESSSGPERAEFDRIRREEGLQAALTWRDARR
jgi:enoyl-CoA hydratase